jgi:hypothetical protein
MFQYTLAMDQPKLDTYSKRRPVDVLSRQNHEQWFRLMKSHLEGEEMAYVIEEHPPTKPINRFPTPESSTSSVIETDPSSRIAHLSITDELYAKWKRHDAKVRYLIEISIGEFDRERIQGLDTAYAQWEGLEKKYQETLPSAGRQYLHEFVTYRMGKETTIQEAWTQLSRLARKVAGTRTSLKQAFTQKEVFQQLLQSLPPQYNTIRDAIDGNPNIDPELALERLEEKEAQFKATEAAMVSNRPRQEGRRRHSNSSGSSRSPKGPKGYKCYICQRNHRVSACEFLEKAQQYAQRQLDKRSASPKAQRGTQIRSKHRSHPRKHRAYEAESDSNIHSSDTENEQEPDEFAAISKDVTCKIPKSTWIADSGASSHMTDNKSLFSSILKRITTRTIKVGGGYLYTSYAGPVKIKAQNGGVVTLARVYYVPGLGANLLSGRRLCQNGLRGCFTDKSLTMINQSGKTIVEATLSGGVYLVDWVAQDEEVALNAQVQEAKPRYEIALSSSADIPEPKGITQEGTELYRLWHRRFGHLSHGILKDLHKVTTLSKPVPKGEEICEVCSLTKFRNQTNKALSERKDDLLALVSIDTCGPLPVTIQGNRYFLQIVDNYSRKLWSVPMKKKDEAIRILREWKLKVELQTGKKLQAVRSDNAPELKMILEEWCLTFGIKPEFTVPYTSSQNGVAERAIQTSESNARAMLKDSGLPVEFWDKAIETDAYLRNRIASGPTIEGKKTSPEEAFTGKTPSIDHIRVWGCKCYTYVDPRSLPSGSRHDKLMDRGRVAVLVGYDENTTRQYQLWAPDLRRTIRATVVRFSEQEKGGDTDLQIPVLHKVNATGDSTWNGTRNELPARNERGRPRLYPEASKQIPAMELQTKDKDDQDYTPKDDIQPAEPKQTRSKTIANREEWEQPNQHQELRIDVPIPDTAVGEKHQAYSDNSGDELSKEQNPIEPNDNGQTLSHVEVPAISEESKKRYRTYDSDDDLPEAKHMRAMIASATTPKPTPSPYEVYEVELPVTYRTAVSDTVHGRRWQNAIDAELDALRANATWTLADPPKGANLVSSKWVFALKTNSLGAIERYKARLVARGFSQIHGVDYYDTFAPTVRVDTLRTILALVSLEDLECHQIDVNNAFTQSTLSEDIYMLPPDGLDIPEGKVLKMQKSLYGLKQAAKDWYNNCSNALGKLGFSKGLSDPCLFLHRGKGIIILIYVDDFTIAAKNLHEVEWFKAKFSERFKIKDLGEIHKILGIRIVRNRANRIITLDQCEYILRLARSLDMEEDTHKKSAKLPMNGYDSIRQATPDDKPTDIKRYQKAIGGLMHAMVYTRPDIAFALGKLSQFMGDPREHHWHGLKALIRYVRSTPNTRIEYKPDQQLQILGYTDSDYGADKIDRKSTIGTLWLLGGGPILWRSKKQKSTATSSTDAEYMAMSKAAKDAEWFKKLFYDLGYPQYLGKDPYCVELKGDNNSAINLVKNGQLSDSTKHIEIPFHYIHDLYKKGRIAVSYIPTDQMAADGLTKPLQIQPFERFKDLIGLTTIG